MLSSFSRSLGLSTTFSLSYLIHWANENRELSLGALISFCVLCAVRYISSPYRKLPPGPRGYPIIGSVLELRAQQWLKFTEWRKQYGDIIYLNAAGQPMVILNSQKVAADLLDRRAGIYSDRPRNIVSFNIMTGGLFFVLSQYNDTWRRMRKAAHEGLNKGVVKDFHEIQTKEALLLAAGGLAEPAQWDKHLRRAAASTILSVVYDYPTIKSEQDRNVKLINDCIQRLTEASYPGAHLVNIFPWMLYIPSRFAKWKRDAENWCKHDTAMFENLFNNVHNSLREGDDQPSLCATLIREADRHKLSLRENSWLAGAMYIAGAETTSTTMAWFSLAMLAYPDAQARAQAELDTVVGRTRIPTFADYPHLPYIRATVKEALRWRPVGPLGIPHRSTEDDWYEGMFIPKGTVCIPNVWHLNRDPEIYGKDADHFNPARFMDANGNIAPGPSDAREESHVSFGFGRRLCVGRHVANNSLFIDIAILLWATKMDRKRDSSGSLLPLDVDGYMDHGLAVHPIPYECDITPRFPEAVTLLKQELELRGL